MNRRRVLGFFNTVLVFCIFNNTIEANAQTYYYALSKKIENGHEYTNTAGGQFITIKESQCFDSDYTGESVGNGILRRDKNNKHFKDYIGDSYFGAVIYRFKNDLTLLNVIVNNQLIYVYYKATPPKGVYTCSLIKKSGTINTGTNSNHSTQGASQWQGPPAINSGNSGNTGSGVNSSSGTGRHVETETECRLCHGTGKCQRCNGNGRYYASGIGTGWHDCTACNRTGDCSQCGGKGKTKTYRYDW